MSTWADTSNQALSRNMRMLACGFTSQVFGPCTSELLYETAVRAIVDVACGAALELGTRPAESKYPNYASGLENKFAAEVTKASAGLSREFANEISKALIPKYEERLDRPSKRKSFTKCTDLKTLQPSKEWSDIYHSVKQELVNLGFPYDKTLADY